MFAKRAISVGVPLALGAAVFAGQPKLHNESKRRFYEDETDVVPVPGTVIPAPASEIEALGSSRIVSGASVRSDKNLEQAFKSARETAHGVLVQAQNYVDQGYSKYNNTERQVTTTVSALHDKHEDLLPNSIYIVVAALSGNIAARQRGILAKAVFPVALGLASFKYFLPQTFANTTSFLWKLEQQKLPHIAEQQEYAVIKAGDLVQSIESTAQAGKKSFEDKAQSLKKSIADATGLNIDEEVSKK
ncbi:uncharacterized protein CANTADRAFT_23805 [Suhomyces tanzawaensis NRRL Y-17324]|uniref:MICOS complex subunit n=1 Tax=Suhomyces tanzawaensis NRRL Y-17324 TaxID=984487 RepID=A0A1E4SBT5_9ASCO|nr:uncharacterized protein CANTADRAFT_23805 [Suhomyces tanzawaensis NRRL Y-17324]ODV76963.1 hypothetical protein CANTADRAFT_23805 [Suhomyces tanzawaensis NRRL Y-17324]